MRQVQDRVARLGQVMVQQSPDQHIHEELSQRTESRKDCADNLEILLDDDDEDSEDVFIPAQPRQSGMERSQC